MYKVIVLRTGEKQTKLLQWFSGNISFHHIHHLNAKIPSYNLERAYRENPLFHVKPLTLLSGLERLKWRVSDEANRRMVWWDAVGESRSRVVGYSHSSGGSAEGR